MKKNYKLVVWISTEQKERLERQAKEEDLFVAELCRRKLLGDIILLYPRIKTKNINTSGNYVD